MPNNITDLIIFDNLFHTAASERIAQNVQAFNGAVTTAGTGNTRRVAGIQLEARAIVGHAERYTTFQRIPNLIQERDPTSNAAVADLALTQVEHVAIKFNRRIGPVKATYDQWRKVGMNNETMSINFGEQAGDDIFQDYLNTTLAAMVAALGNTTVAGSNLHVDSGVGQTMSPQHIIRGKSKMGDNMNTALLVMHSGDYYNLVLDNAGSAIFGVADVTIREGTPATGGHPVLVTDSNALVDNPAVPAVYTSLGVMEGGVQLRESEGRLIKTEDVLGEENIGMRAQGEHAFNLEMMGFAWDMANGGTSPDAATAAIATNWDMIAASHKHIFGYGIQSAAV